MLQRIFYPNEYFYIPTNNAKIDENPIADLQGNLALNRKMLGIRFVNPINSEVSQFPRDIQEVWFFK